MSHYQLIAYQPNGTIEFDIHIEAISPKEAIVKAERQLIERHWENKTYRLIDVKGNLIGFHS